MSGLATWWHRYCGIYLGMELKLLFYCSVATQGPFVPLVEIVLFSAFHAY